MISDVLASEKPSAVAKKHGVGRPTVYRWLDEAGYDRSKRPANKPGPAAGGSDRHADIASSQAVADLGFWTRPALPSEFQQRAIDEVLNGTPVPLVASQHGVHKFTVYRWLRKAGIDVSTLPTQKAKSDPAPEPEPDDSKTNSGSVDGHASRLSVTRRREADSRQQRARIGAP